MALLQTLGKGQGYLKAGFLGFPKSGKTFTATELAIGVYKFFGNCGDVIFFDTEGGSEYVAHRVKADIGKDMIGLKSRSLSDLMAVTNEIKPNDVFIVDSVTHIWRELCDSHLAHINEVLKRKGKLPRFQLEFQDWGPIKATWAKWTDWYLNSHVHVIICGRAGYEYDMQVNEETDKKELIKTGVKMKTESEFGFEPSLLVEMDRVIDPASRRVTKRQAVVIGDRFNLLDGKVFINPKFRDFGPHVRMLKPDAHTSIDTALKTDTGVNGEGDAEWNAERRRRVVFAEEIQGLLLHHIPGQSAVDKQRKATLLFDAFKTRSWTAIEGLSSERLKAGLYFLRGKLEAKESVGLPTFGTADEPVDWPSDFQGPQLIWNGTHLRLDESTGNYSRVDEVAAA